MFYHFTLQISINSWQTNFWRTNARPWRELTILGTDRAKLTLFALVGKQTPTRAAQESERQVASPNTPFALRLRARIPLVLCMCCVKRIVNKECFLAAFSVETKPSLSALLPWRLTILVQPIAKCNFFNLVAATPDTMVDAPLRSIMLHHNVEATNS